MLPVDFTHAPRGKSRFRAKCHKHDDDVCLHRAYGTLDVYRSFLIINYRMNVCLLSGSILANFHAFRCLYAGNTYARRDTNACAVAAKAQGFNQNASRVHI